MNILTLLGETWSRWIEDGAFRVSASLAYYAVFSMAPLLIILTFFVGLVYQGDTLEQTHLQITQFVGADAADLVAEAVVQAGDRLRGGLAYTILAFLLMLVGVSAFSNQLRESMNAIWNVPESKNEGIWDMFRNRFGTLMVVFFMGVLLQLSVLLSSAISAYRHYVQSLVPNTNFIWHWVEMGISFGVVVTLIAMIYRWLPDANVAWRDVWVGAVITALFLTAGKSLIAFYLARSSFGSIYGAAGSLMVVLAWLYYSSLILLFGAEFTQVYAERYGHSIVPKRSTAASA